jgi:hypothetical protein
MTSAVQFEAAIRLFFKQHAILHSQAMAETEPWSFEDDIFDDITDEIVRRIPKNCENSIAWVIWHIARIEDMTMNLLVAGTDQIFNQDNWLEKLKVPIHHSGNVMDISQVEELSQAIDIDVLRDYRLAVGRCTREIVNGLSAEDLKRKVDSAGIQRIMDEGELVEEARAIAKYWSRRDVAGLLLMPSTRHNLVHLNEALQLKRRSA